MTLVRARGLSIVVLLGVCVGKSLMAGDIPTITHPTLHFGSDSTELVSEDRGKLDENVDWLKANASAVVILEGHCDRTGSAIYNMELGDRRAREIKSYLVEKGISQQRMIMVVSFGEAQPAVAGASHAALQQNRRVELVLR